MCKKIGKIPSFGPSKNLGPHLLASTKDVWGYGILEAMPIVPQGSQRSQNGCQATQTTLPRRGRAKTTRKIAAKTTEASSKVRVDLFIRRLVQTTGKFFRKGMKMHVYVYKNTYV